MQLAFRLAQILADKQSNSRGIITKIVEKTSLKRHQVSNILHNRVQYVSLDVLAELCSYLVQHEKIDPALLPGALFVHEPGDFYSLLTERRRIDACFGVRKLGDASWVMASDSLLNGALLLAITGVRERTSSGRAPEFQQRHITAPPRSPDKKEARKKGAGGKRKGKKSTDKNGIDFQPGFDEAKKYYEEFNSHDVDCALVCLGSQKSCSLVDILFGNAFNVDSFKEDKVRTAKERGCPFFFFYRSTDTCPPSCAGGTRLTVTQKTDTPGLHYETESGRWACCPFDDEHDAGLIFYVHDPAMGRVEMALSGFTGRSTFCLGDVFTNKKAQLWPPQVYTKEKMYGAFIVKFEFHEGGENPTEPIRTEVVRLDSKVIERRLGLDKPASEEGEA